MIVHILDPHVISYFFMPGETVNLFLRMPDLNIVLQRRFHLLQHSEPPQNSHASLQVLVRINIYCTQHRLNQIVEYLFRRKCR